MLFILRLWEAKRGGCDLRSHGSPVTVGPGLDLSDLFPPVSQGPTVWADMWGRNWGSPRTGDLSPINSAPSRPQALEQAFLSLWVVGGLRDPL